MIHGHCKYDYFGPLTFLQGQIRSKFHKILLITYWQHLGTNIAIRGLRISKIIYIQISCHMWPFSFWSHFYIAHLCFSFKCVIFTVYIFLRYICRHIYIYICKWIYKTVQDTALFIKSNYCPEWAGLADVYSVSMFLFMLIFVGKAYLLKRNWI